MKGEKGRGTVGFVWRASLDVISEQLVNAILELTSAANVDLGQTAIERTDSATRLT